MNNSHISEVFPVYFQYEDISRLNTLNFLTAIFFFLEKKIAEQWFSNSEKYRWKFDEELTKDSRTQNQGLYRHVTLN